MMSLIPISSVFFFFFNDTATTEIYTLSLHDALPDLSTPCAEAGWMKAMVDPSAPGRGCSSIIRTLRRSEEHTSELQSRQYLVCRLLLEKKNKKVTVICVASRYVYGFS